jgi:hypothetical protein
MQRGELQAEKQQRGDSRRERSENVHIINGIFAAPDDAVRASEQAREVTRARSSIRVLLRGERESAVELAVFADNSSWTRVNIACFALGIVGAAILIGLGARALFVVAWLFWSILGGLMMATWLTGQRYRGHIRRAHAHVRAQYEQELAAGHGIVTAVVSTRSEADKVVRVFRNAGGQVVEGSFTSVTVESQRPLHT